MQEGFDSERLVIPQTEKRSYGCTINDGLSTLEWIIGLQTVQMVLVSIQRVQQIRIALTVLIYKVKWREHT